MRTVVAFGGEHKELQRFQGALVQARRGGVPRWKNMGLHGNSGGRWFMGILNMVSKKKTLDPTPRS